MNKFNFFNKKRVSVSDLNDTQSFIDNNSINRFGSQWSKGLLKENTIALSGAQTLILGSIDQGNGTVIKRTPANWEFTFGSTSEKFSIPVPAATTTQYFGLLALNSAGNLFGILTNENYRTSPTQFQSKGNIDIPLDASPTIGHVYHIWISERIVNDQNYNRSDKNGQIFYPKQINGYDITIVDNSYVAPVGDYIKIGRILYNGSGINPTFFYDEPRIYAGIFQQNVKINIDNTNKPTTYANGETKSLADHISAIGNNTVTPINPHGTLAEDIDALNGVNLTSIGMYKNGILLPDTYDQLSNTALFQVTMHNTGSSKYIKLINNASDPKFIVRGKLYSITDIVGYNTIFAAAVVSYASASYSQGWYPIYLDVTTDGAFTLNIGNGTFTPVTSNLFYQNDSTDTNKIYLGYVFVYNDSISFELRRFENDTATSANNQPILPFYTYGSLNPKDICKSINTEYQTHSKNLIAYNFRNDGLYSSTNTTGVTNGLTINKDYVGNASALTLTKSSVDAPSNLSITVTHVPYTARMIINTLPQSARGLDQRITKPRIYSLSFSYSNADDYTAIRVSLDGGTTFYNVPGANPFGTPSSFSSGPNQFKITTSTYPSNIIFEFDQNVTATYNNFTLTNVQLVEGIIDDILVDDVIYTNQIAFNSSISASGDNTGATPTTKETRITKINLDDILRIIPFGTKLIQTFASGDRLANMNARNNAVNINTDISKINNLEIWFVHGSLAWESLGVGNGHKRFEARVNLASYGMGTTYKYLFSSFMPTTSVVTPTVSYFLPTLVQTVNTTWIDIYTTAYNLMITLGPFNYYGIIIVTKLI